MKTLSTLLVAILLTACSFNTEGERTPPSDHTYDASKIPQPEPEPEYECRSEHNCDLNYKEFNIHLEGQWEVIDTEEWDKDEGITSYPKEEGNCITTAEGNFSVMFEHKEWNAYWWDYYGSMYGNIIFTTYCPQQTYERNLKFSYYFWDLYNPYFISGMDFYDEPGTGWDFDGEGAMIYNADNDNNTAIFIMKIPNFYGRFLLKPSGKVGECDENKYHCYANDDCSNLIADCVSSKQECEYYGGGSYSPHKDGHEYETCNLIE